MRIVSTQSPKHNVQALVDDMAIGFHQYRHRRLGRRIQQGLRLGFQDHFTPLAVAAADSNGKPSPHGIGAAPEERQNGKGRNGLGRHRSEEHTSELQSLMNISYDVFGFKNK